MMTDHSIIEALIPAYALGATDPEETRQVEAHLSDCAPCRDWLAEYQRLGDALLFAAPPMPAPPHLAGQLRRAIESAAPRPGAVVTPPTSPYSGPSAARTRRVASRWAWLAGWRLPALGAVVAALVLLIATNAYWYTRSTAAERQVTAQATAIAALAEAPTVTLKGDAPAPDARGVLYFHNSGDIAVLHTYAMPPLQPGKAYQLWLIRGDQRDSGGVFRVNDEGEGILLIHAPRPLSQYQRVGVTVEPLAGSPAPTTPRVLGGSL
jgi:anti-sigma-K factor RskA